MCSHKEGENGHWFTKSDVLTLPTIASTHRVFYARVYQMTALEREAVFKEAAMKNLRASPLKVAINWACNLCRLAFGFPRSYLPEELRAVVLIAANGPVILLSALMGLLGLWRWRSVPVEIWLLMGFTAFYLGGSSLAPSLPRYFVIVYPLLILGSACVWYRHIEMRLKSGAVL